MFMFIRMKGLMERWAKNALEVCVLKTAPKKF